MANEKATAIVILSLLAGALATDSPKAEKPQPARVLRVVVLSPQGEPLPDAKVRSSISTHEKGFKNNHDYKTDAAGVARVELPKSFYMLRLWASKKGLAHLLASWEQNELGSGEELPAEYVFRMERAVTAGGRIVDEKGKAIARAKVFVMIANNPKSARDGGRTRYNTLLAGRDDAAITDAQGQWRIDNVPDHPQIELGLQVSHPDYAPDRRWHKAQEADGVTMARLRQGTAVLTLKRGVIGRGRVTDAAGKPIKDALVLHNGYSEIAVTDSDGCFRLPPMDPGETTLIVVAAGWAPLLRHIALREGLPRQDFRLAPGKPIRLRIVDAAGKPVPKAQVCIMDWRRNRSLQLLFYRDLSKMADVKIPRQTDANGVWEWAAAPDDPVTLEIRSQSFASIELTIAGGAAERTIVLKPPHHITGRVTDAATGKPIPSFTVIPLDVFRKDSIHAERYNGVVGKNGRLDYLATRTDIPLRLRVEAPGYRTQDGPEFRVGEDAFRKQDFRLHPSAPISGMVCDAAGKPVAKAEVLLATPTEEIRLQSQTMDRSNHKTITDAMGRFTFPDPGEPFAVVAQSDAGFAFAEYPSGQHDTGTLRLRPWASIRGQFRDGGQLYRAPIRLEMLRLDARDRPRISTVMSRIITRTDGRFEFPRVPPIPVSVSVVLTAWKDEGYRSGPSVPLDLKPGQRVELNLGGGATIVNGKVKLTGKVPADLNCTYSINYLVERAPGIDPPPEIARLGFDARKGWRDAWFASPEGQVYLNTLRHWFVKLAPDGAFRISGVPPGEYDLAIVIYAKPEAG